MRIGPVFLMGFCIQKFHIKDKDVFMQNSVVFFNLLIVKR